MLVAVITMVFTILTSALLSVWIIFCVGLYCYYYFIENYSDASFSDQSPSSAHTTLKLLIEKILREASQLPPFYRRIKNPPESEERTYEDLLATAILNKIIDKRDDRPDWSGAQNIDDDGVSARYRGNRSSEVDSTSVSSIDDYVYSDSSHGSSKYVDRVSLTIQQRIEQIPSINEHDDVDGDQYFSSGKLSSLSDDNSNWYLQKRQFQGTSSPVPVPMLVPNPITTAKVLIGDQEIDDTSDLSDANSESEDLHTNLIIDSSVTIEEKAVGNDSSDEQTSFDSGVREDRDDCSENLYYTEAKNEKVWDVDDSSLLSSYSNVEQDSEYLEKYSSLPTKTYATTTSHTPSPVDPHNNNNNKSKYDLLDFETPPPDSQHTDESFEALYQGSYSKKEKEKWKHPITMQDNPYSEENIRRRIHKNTRYGSDYYAKQASLPSGTLKSHEADDFFFRTVEEDDGDISLHRAEPITLVDTSLSSVDFEDRVETTTEPNVDLNLRLVQNYKVLYEDGKKIEIKVNDKQVFSPVNGEVIIQNFSPITEQVEKDFPTSEQKPEVLIEIDNDVYSAMEPVTDIFGITTPRTEKIPTNRQYSGKPGNTIEVTVNKKEDPEGDIFGVTSPNFSTNHIQYPGRPKNTIEVRLNKKEAFARPVFIEHKKENSVNRKEPVHKKEIPLILDALSRPKKENVPASLGPFAQDVVTSIEVDFETDVPILKENVSPTYELNPFKQIAPENIYTTQQSNDWSKEPISRQLSGGSKKSDNTLIRKIYSNPTVRNFALANRQQIPGVPPEEIKKEEQKNEVRAVLMLKPSNIDNFDKIVRNYETKPNFDEQIVSPEQEAQVPVASPRQGVQLLQPKQETEVPVASSRLLSPKHEVQVEVPSPEQEVPQKFGVQVIPTNFGVQMMPPKQQDDFVEAHNFSLEFSDNEESIKERITDNDRDVHELRGKRLVANTLGNLSKSFPNLVRSTSVKPDQKNVQTLKAKFRKSSVDYTHPEVHLEEEDDQEHLPSVKDLRKLFEKQDTSRFKRDKPVHSLTARSISKEMKQRLSNENGYPSVY